MLYKDITEKIIGAAYRVYNQLGFGFLESVYKKSMMIELAKLGLHAKEDVSITVYYDELPVGYLIAIRKSVISEDAAKIPKFLNKCLRIGHGMYFVRDRIKIKCSK
jgi:hypothetical protein